MKTFLDARNYTEEHDYVTKLRDWTSARCRLVAMVSEAVHEQSGTEQHTCVQITGIQV